MPAGRFVHALDDLKDDPFDRKPVRLGGGEGRADAVFRAIDGLGHELMLRFVDIPSFDARRDRGDSAGLVEAVSVCIVALIRHPKRGPALAPVPTGFDGKEIDSSRISTIG